MFTETGSEYFKGCLVKGGGEDVTCRLRTLGLRRRNYGQIGRLVPNIRFAGMFYSHLD